MQEKIGKKILSHASHSLDIFWRQAFKGELKEEYSSMCGGNYPVKGFLFGEDVQDKIREVIESLRVAHSTHRFQPYQTHGSRSLKRFPFLGQRQGRKRRGGGHGHAWRHATQAAPNLNNWGQQKMVFSRKK
ncbi:hypothetical protein ElyMa_000674400 [Elysia marginata]|uniref:Uncharacterized protein n=1 Tax=Elysia marginata TaxID=1093978 RepID=A0AAV4GGL5_9GAST|nr:hypothetical protein ElyMa_000674400 [Elysia marginata]